MNHIKQVGSGKIMRTNIKDNSRRKFTGGGARPDKRAARQQAAQARQEAYSLLTPQQKLERLDQAGFRALKQRARLHRMLREERG